MEKTNWATRKRISVWQTTPFIKHQTKNKKHIRAVEILTARKNQPNGIRNAIKTAALYTNPTVARQMAGVLFSCKAGLPLMALESAYRFVDYLCDDAKIDRLVENSHRSSTSVGFYSFNIFIFYFIFFFKL